MMPAPDPRSPRHPDRGGEDPDAIAPDAVAPGSITITRTGLEPAPTPGIARRQCNRCGGTAMEIYRGPGRIVQARCVTCGRWVKRRGTP
jgi:hypothetical protein